MGNEKELWADFKIALSQVDDSIMPLERASQLLAYVYVFGGGNEAVTQNFRLYADIRTAQFKAHIDGGQIPEPQHMRRIQELITECAEGKADWIRTEICEKYNLKWTPEIYLKPDPQFLKYKIPTG